MLHLKARFGDVLLLFVIPWISSTAAASYAEGQWPPQSECDDRTLLRHYAAGEYTALQNETLLRLGLHHPFLNVSKGVAHDVDYEVQVEVKAPVESNVSLLLTSIPKGVFHSVTGDVSLCGERNNSVVVHLTEVVRFTSISWRISKFSEPTIRFLAFYVNRRRKTELVQATYSKRKECFRIIASMYGNLVSEEAELRWCLDFRVLLQAPPDMKMNLQIQLLRIPVSVGRVSVILQSEEEEGVRLRNSTSNSTNLTDYFFASNGRYIMIRYTHCTLCKIQGQFYSLHQFSGCNRTYTSSSEVVHSIGYPHHSYFPSLDCYSEIVAPSGHRVVVTVKDLDIQGDGDTCDTDFLSLYPTVYTGEVRLCGRSKTYGANRTTSRIVSEEEVLIAYFHSDSMIERRGYSLQLQFVQLCENISYTDKNRTFCFTQDILSYFGRNNCHIVIHVPLGFEIEVEFSVSETHRRVTRRTTSACSDNFLQIDRGNNGHSRVCIGSDSLEPVHSIGNAMNIGLHITSDSQDIKGFCTTYRAVVVNESLTDCEYGWVSWKNHCYIVHNEPLSWMEANDRCKAQGGYLVSIPDQEIQDLMEKLIRDSWWNGSSHAYWIGANDITYENCFEWADSQQYGYTNWFPGWPEHDGYSAQPSDDGLSRQDCVEMRDLFRYPSKGEGQTARFFWNDRDCLVANPFICQRPKPGVIILPPEVPVCPESVILTSAHSHEVISSPRFPLPYPSSIECRFSVIAQPEYRIEIIFTDFVLEDHDNCAYDFLEITEFQESVQEDPEKKRLCGNWEDRLKLLRRLTKGNKLYLRFYSDYSHAYKGFRAEVIMRNESSESTRCHNKRFRLFDDHCYLVASYPEVSWSTAHRICAESQAELTSLRSKQEEKFVAQAIQEAQDFAVGATYWIGGKKDEGKWMWTDDTTVNITGKFNSRGYETNSGSISMCLALQWRHLGNSSSMHWIAKACDHPGKYVCRKKALVLPKNLNMTLTEPSGTLTSLNYPFNYVNDLHYTVVIEGSPKSRIVVAFSHIDLEWQKDCLYDYVALQSEVNGPETRVCGQRDAKTNSFTFVSENNTMFLTFHSDFSVTGTGFMATWENLDLSECQGKVISLSERTWVVSQRYRRGYVPGLDCTATYIAPIGMKILFTVVDFEVGLATKNGACQDDYLQVSLDEEDNQVVDLCGNSSQVPRGYQLVSYTNQMTLRFKTSIVTQHFKRGYNITFDIWDATALETSISLEEGSEGFITSLNYPYYPLDDLSYTQRLVAPLGHRVELRVPETRPIVCYKDLLTVEDAYRAESKTWALCQDPSKDGEEGDHEGVLMSMFNTLHLHSRNKRRNEQGFIFVMHYRVIRDPFFANKMSKLKSWDGVDACKTNPCRNGGACVTDKQGEKFQCHCTGSFTGLFCEQNWCDTHPCGDRGYCNLTSTGYFCDCFPGYTGLDCNESTTPCNPNPCGAHGVCTVVNGTFQCECQLFYEGPRCERYVFKIPYKPLSQRMLEEPFWLGLITVFSVLVVILLVYCIKRKFAEKIEKFFAEEIEKSKNNPSPPTTRYSLSSNPPSLTPASLSPQTCPKSFFSRIRKHSLRSSTSSTSPTDREPTSALSFDDVFKKAHPPNKRTVSSNGAEPEKKDDEKSRILASLVKASTSPRQRRMSLDELIRLSEQKIMGQKNAQKDEVQHKEKEGKAPAPAEKPASPPQELTQEETSFISRLSPLFARHSAPSFSEFGAIKEQPSVEHNSSSDSLSCEGRTREVKAEVLPRTPSVHSEQGSLEEQLPRDPSPVPPQILVTPEACSSEDLCKDTGSGSCSDKEHCDSDSSSKPTATGRSSPASPKSSMLEVPHVVSPMVSPEHSKPRSDPAGPRSSQSLLTKQVSLGSPKLKKPDITVVRKLSVELPPPKILITTNMSSCESDETSPPHTPNPAKTMTYLSPLTIISSSADRTISESNLSTSGYSSLSSPGMSRCNSSSPLPDELDPQAMHHRRKDLSSPPKGPHLLSPFHFAMKADTAAFHFPPTQAYPVQVDHHAHGSPTSWPKRRASVAGSTFLSTKDLEPVANAARPCIKRQSSYHTTSTEDSVDDEGIEMDSIDLKIREGEVTSAEELEKLMDIEVSISPEKDADDSTNSEELSPALLELPLAITSLLFPGSSPEEFCNPKFGRKSDKPKKPPDKHKRTSSVSPIPTTPVHEHPSESDGKMRRNSSRASMAGPIFSSSDSEDMRISPGTRQKMQGRRTSKKAEPTLSPSSKSRNTSPAQSSRGLIKGHCEIHGAEKNSGRASPVIAHPALRPKRSSSSESLISTAEDFAATDCSTDCDGTWRHPSHGMRHGHSAHWNQAERPCSLAPPTSPTVISRETQTTSQGERWLLQARPRSFDSARPPPCTPNDPPPKAREKRAPLLSQSRSYPSTTKRGYRLHPMDSIDSSIPSDSEEDHLKQKSRQPLLKHETGPPHQHPGLKRQEALLEDDGSDESSSETTVLLRKSPSSSVSITPAARNSPRNQDTETSSSPSPPSVNVKRGESEGSLNAENKPDAATAPPPPPPPPSAQSIFHQNGSNTTSNKDNQQTAVV